MTERRIDDRVKINKECNIYLKKAGEIACLVKDISEVGIAFEIPSTDETLINEIKKAKKIKFSYLDEFTYLSSTEFCVVTGIAHYVRVVEHKDNIVVGCTIEHDSKIKKYVSRKKVSTFMEKYCQNSKQSNKEGEAE